MDGQRSDSLTGNWDTRISRRVLLRTGGSAAAGLLLLGRSAYSASAAPPHGGNPFSLGVASGDPTPQGFVLWTRLLPAGTPLDGSVMKQEPYGVRYEIAEDEDFRRIVRRGTEDAVWEESHTVHAEIAGLQPDRWYWYRFKWGPTVSPVGRTRTAPAAGTDVDTLTFGFVSCQNYMQGYYHAYADLAANEELELVVHLGDYMYENGSAGIPDPALFLRKHDPDHQAVSLTDYRCRYAQCKQEPELQAAHALCPWLPTWDDHEFENNYADLDVDPDEPLEAMAARRAAAYLAYWEHQPLSRSRKPVGKDMNLYRRADWGTLARFHVIDSRQYRADQLNQQCGRLNRTPSGYCVQQLDENRQLLGDTQRLWLQEGLAERPDGWNVLANQVGFAPQANFNAAGVRQFGLDSWDGYAGDRQRLLNFVKAAPLRNLVVITGDRHIHSVRNVPEHYTDIAGPAVATEFIGSSISSRADEGLASPEIPYDGLNNPQILWGDERRGWVRVEATSDTWRSDFRVITSSVHQRENVQAATAASYVVLNGEPGAVGM
jgi:alkaline phosphatase D